MPLPAIPAIIAGIGSLLARPAVLSTIGSFLPSVVSALTGSPTEEEAKVAVAPHREAMLGELVKSGLSQPEAERMADEAVAGEVQGHMNGGGIPPWLEGALSVAGGIGGFKAGKWLKGAGAAKAAATASAAAIPGKAVVDDAAKTMTSPFVRPVQDPGARMTGGTQTRQRTLTPEDLPTAEISSPFTPAARPIDRLTGAPRAPSGPADPLTGVPREEAPAAAAQMDSPFIRSHPLTGGRAYDTGERAAMAASDRNAMAEDAARRQALDEIAAAEAEAKPRQMNAMRSYDDVQRNRGREP